MFCDDTKLHRPVSNLNDAQLLQNDLNCVVNWSNTWLLELNFTKCKVLRIGGWYKEKFDYFVGTNHLKIDSVESERDLGVIFDKSLSFKEHINKKIGLAKRNLALIKRTFKFLNPSTFLTLYKSLVRPHLEFCSPVWNNDLKFFSNELEKVQKLATRYVTSLRGLKYSDRLRKLKISTLKYRRLREDIICIFRICKTDFLKNSLITFKPNAGTRGHGLALAKRRLRTKQAKQFLINRIHGVWNSFPSEFAEINSLNSLKNYIEKFIGASDYKYDHLCLLQFGSRLAAGSHLPDN